MQCTAQCALLSLRYLQGADSFNCVTSMTHFAFLLQSDHTCEYVYSLKMDQFAVHEAHDQPMTLTATVQITCESSKL